MNNEHLKLIEYFVNDEVQSTDQKELTSNQIMRKAGINQAEHYLVEIMGNHRESYKDKADLPIHLHEKANFVTVYVGPVVVS